MSRFYPLQVAPDPIAAARRDDGPMTTDGPDLDLRVRPSATP